MQATPSLAEAEQAVAEQRRLMAAEGQRHLPELAKALAELGRAYELDERMEDALAAARESVATLLPEFLQNPQRFSAHMRALVTQYVAFAQRSRAQLDSALLTPIAQALGDLTRADDEADG